MEGSKEPAGKTVALAGNPNVGKSTVFNALTGLRQHTGNWAGKTVRSALGCCVIQGEAYQLVDLPGCASLLSRTGEERVAREFLCSGQGDAMVVVCDATNLQRGLVLVLQVLEVTSRVVVCVNLMDEACRKGVRVDLERLSGMLGVPVVGMRRPQWERASRPAGGSGFRGPGAGAPAVASRGVSPGGGGGCGKAGPAAAPPGGGKSRWRALRLLEGAETTSSPQVAALLEDAWDRCPQESFGEAIATAQGNAAGDLARRVVTGLERGYSPRDRKLDRLFTGKWTAFPVMALLLFVILWLTMVGANVPSQLLSDGFTQLGVWLRELFQQAGAPGWVTGLVVDGAYTTLTWVVAVMLPPMAIFFPLFTLLEDLGYLPRMAYNLDRCFQGCGACGKQALTMSMGFGCNAAGVVGCQIIDSPGSG